MNQYINFKNECLREIKQQEQDTPLRLQTSQWLSLANNI